MLLVANDDKYQFQRWAVSVVNAIPVGGKMKGVDQGIDGVIQFEPDGEKTERAVVFVRGGKKVSVAMVRALNQILDRGPPL